MRYLRSPVLSIRLAVLTVSPNKQYLGIFVPFELTRHDKNMKLHASILQ